MRPGEAGQRVGLPDPDAPSAVVEHDRHEVEVERHGDAHRHLGEQCLELEVLAQLEPEFAHGRSQPVAIGADRRRLIDGVGELVRRRGDRSDLAGTADGGPERSLSATLALKDPGEVLERWGHLAGEPPRARGADEQAEEGHQ